MALVWPDLWVVDPGSDVMPAHAPDTVDCSVGYGDELGVFEIDTGLCNYGRFSQSTAAEILAGERVEFVFTHDDLMAPEPAVGHLAVAIDGRLVWETEVAIPKPTALSPVSLHLHNNGYNNWRVIGFDAGG